MTQIHRISALEYSKLVLLEKLNDMYKEALSFEYGPSSHDRLVIEGFQLAVTTINTIMSELKEATYD